MSDEEEVIEPDVLWYDLPELTPGNRFAPLDIDELEGKTEGA